MLNTVLCISTFAVSLQQTVPENSPVCPGQPLVYSFTTVSTGALKWVTGQFSVSVVFTVSQPVNETVTQPPFTFQLVDVVMDGAMLVSTATSEMAYSSLDGLKIECSDGINNSTLYVDVAGTCMYACTYLIEMK